MSRSNYDKPFYVDVGTSIVAVRCASNHDVVLRYDHIRLPQTIQLAEDACDRMNKEAEISKPLRNCDVGTPEEQVQRMTDAFCMKQWKDGLIRCSLCPISCTNGRRTCTLTWAQMPYEAEEGGAAQ